MKTRILGKLKIAGWTIGLLLCMASCSDLLNEQPRDSYTPEFFTTAKGVEGGITSLYAHLRYIYGQGYYYNACETGTDEVTYAQSADGNFKDADLSGVGNLDASSSRSDVIWSESFTNINTANAILENGAEAGVEESLLAEAHFFRAFDYFNLVRTFGGVPLDLGSGELAYNTTPARTSVRNTVPEVYTKAIFPDLLTAVEVLPDQPRVTGGVTKTLARLYLAKAYLTYGWWLENPNDIPTYPECERTDSDGHDANWYFQEAYDYAIEGINNPGPYSLQEYYYDVNEGSNDRNSEIMLYADHTQDDEYYNGGSLTYGSGGAPDNFAGWMMNWNYTNLQAIGVSSDGSQTTINPLRRVAEQSYGRPWTRMCPTLGAIIETFADKTYDSRYDGTFVTVYRGNWSKELDGYEYVLNANGMPVYEGEPILTFLDEEPETEVSYPDGGGENAIGAGTLPDRSDYVVNPSGISRLMYPALWKLGPYRTDNGDGPGQPNAGSTRPFNIAKFSELYFVAAEAAVKGATTQAGMTARDLINVIRARAGKWRWSNSGNCEKIADYSEEMIAETPAVIDIDYILAERSREYFGEGYRWLDLVRTQKWNELADTYEICGDGLGEHTPQTITRTIEDYHYLRPIPQGQLDAMTMSEAEKNAYQNPGYE